MQKLLDKAALLLVLLLPLLHTIEATSEVEAITGGELWSLVYGACCLFDLVL